MAWINQEDIARACGVSVMTVSRALRGQRGVLPEVVARVRLTAKKLGYRPDPLLSALVAHRLSRRPRSAFSVVACITHFETENAWRDNHVTAQAYEGASRRGAEMGFSIQNFWFPGYTARRANLSRILANRGIRGLLLGPLPSPDVEFALEWDKFSVVAIGYTASRFGFSFVASHHSQSLSLIFEEIRQLGYRRPALFFNPWADERSLHQLSGAWYYEMQQVPPRERLPIVRLKERPSPAKVRAWIDRHRPDVIIDTFSPDLPIIRGTGLYAPDDIGYVNTNVKSTASEIAGIFQNFPAMGAVAIERLSILMNKGETGIPKLHEGSITYGTWCPGRTVRTGLV